MEAAQPTQASRRDQSPLETANAPESKGAGTDGRVQADQPAAVVYPLR